MTASSVELAPGVVLGDSRQFPVIAGPCVIESEALTLGVASTLKEIAARLGFPLVFKFDDAKAYAEAVPDLLNAPGPTFVHVLVEPGDEGPISRSSSEPSRYLQSSLAGWSRMMRTALGSD